MNRYPAWKYIIIVVALLLGALYTAPNYFGESPALQVTSGKSTVKVTGELMTQVEQILTKENVKSEGVTMDGAGNLASVRVRFADPDTQFKAKLVLEKDLNTDASDPAYIVTVNLQANTPMWMQKLHALPMFLGLDLRGGVHFLMQVDAKAVLNKKVQGVQSAARSVLRDKNIRHAGIERVGDSVQINFRDAETRLKAKNVLSDQMTELAFADAGEGSDLKLNITLKPAALKATIDEGVKQNISTLSKRVNELGVAEPLIQQQGPDRIVVQLPGVQDVARAKAIIGRTATLEVRLVDETHRAWHRTVERHSVQLGTVHRRQGRACRAGEGRDPDGRLYLQRHGQLRPEPASGRVDRPERRRRPQDARSDARTRRQAHGHRAV